MEADDQDAIFMQYTNMLLDSVLFAPRYRDQITFKIWKRFFKIYLEVVSIKTGKQSPYSVLFKLTLFPYISSPEFKLELYSKTREIFPDQSVPDTLRLVVFLLFRCLTQKAPDPDLLFHSSAYVMMGLNHVIQESPYDQRTEFESLVEYLFPLLIQTWGECRTPTLKVPLNSATSQGFLALTGISPPFRPSCSSLCVYNTTFSLRAPRSSLTGRRRYLAEFFTKSREAGQVLRIDPPDSPSPFFH